MELTCVQISFLILVNWYFYRTSLKVENGIRYFYTDFLKYCIIISSNRNIPSWTKAV